MAVWNILKCAMVFPDNVNQPESDSGTRYTITPDEEQSSKEEFMVNDAATRWLTQQGEENTLRYECASCTYHDPERAYCTYIHTPVAILFVCPQILDKRH